MKNRSTWIACMTVVVLIYISDSCRTINRANKKYDDLAYSEAIPLYKKALAKDSTNADGWAKLGDCYRENNQTAQAEECYAKATGADNSKSTYKLDYAQMLMSNDKYPDAKMWMDQYLKAEPNDTRAAELASGLSHIETFFTNQDKFTVQKLNINTDEAEFCPAFYKEGIVFTSSRLDKPVTHGTSAWTGKKYYSIYYSRYARVNASASESNPSPGATDFTTFEDPVVFLRGVQTKYNNSSVCFAKNGTEMMLTRNEVESNTDTWGNAVYKVKLYSSTLENGKWSEVVPFQYNSDSYSCAHPALTPDGTKLYFASDMPGTYGGMDLWVCNRTGTGWSAPQNMGPAINTKGNELFPTVAEDGTIYFSSNGHEGLGGLDIYSTTDSAGTYSKPKNLGAPYNSSDDDFGLIVDNANNIDYFSSNRTHQGNNDDIYSIRKRIVKLNVLATDSRTKELLDSVTVELIAPDTTQDLSQTASSGRFAGLLSPGRNYKVVAKKANYTADTLEITEAELKAAGDSLTLTMPLGSDISMTGKITNDATESIIPGAHVLLVNLDNRDTLNTVTGSDGMYAFNKLKDKTRYRVIAESDYCDSKFIDTSTLVMTDNNMLRIDIAIYCLRDSMLLKKIYYNLDKYNIRPDAAVELDKLVSLLKKYPGIKIELGSHTDCRASFAYNVRLSQNRAKAAVDYLVKQGISRSRMTAHGYGKTRPVNKCQCDGAFSVPCTEEEYQMNRRTEIRILSL